MKVSTDQIVVAARELFREKGYAGASMQDLAEAVGLKKASLYSRFNSKEALVPDVLALTLSETLEDEAGTAPAAWLEAYERVVRRIADTLSDRKRCVAFHLAYGVSDETPVAKQAVQDYFVRCRNGMSELLSYAIGSKEADVIATDALSRLEGATVWIAVMGDQTPMERAVRDLMLQASRLA